MHQFARLKSIVFLTAVWMMIGSATPALAQSGKYPVHERQYQRPHASPSSAQQTTVNRQVLTGVNGIEFVRDDSGRFWDWSHQDASAWFTSWDGKRVGYVAGATVGLAVLSFADESVSSWAKNLDGGASGSFLDTANEFGGPAAAIVPLAVFAASFAVDDVKFQDAAFTSLQSYVYSNAIVLATKMIVGRSRPDAGEGPHDFNPFSGAASFPSGHTSSVFAVVMPWVFYYPGPITYALAALAVGTAVARIQRQRHWLSDVVAGAAISTTMSYYLYSRHTDAQQLEASIDPISKGMTMQFSFGL
jgi:membrane-associated phospholipid phosphatase